MITVRNKKQKVQQKIIHFGFGNNNEYTYNPVVPNVTNNHIATSSFNENQCTRITEANFNKLLENMENKFNRMSENLQRKHEAQLSRPYFVPHSYVMIFIKIFIIKCFILIIIQLVSRPYLASIYI